MGSGRSESGHAVAPFEVLTFKCRYPRVVAPKPQTSISVRMCHPRTRSVIIERHLAHVPGDPKSQKKVSSPHAGAAFVRSKCLSVRSGKGPTGPGVLVCVACLCC